MKIINMFDAKRQLWKNFNSKTGIEVKMASRSSNLWANIVEKQQAQQTKVPIPEPPKPAEEQKKELTNEQKEVIIQVSDENKKEIEMVDIPELPLDSFDVPQEQQDQSVQDESGGSVVFGIIGTGQAGGRIAEAFYTLGYKKCLAVNTASHDLNGLKTIPENQKMLLDAGTSGGAGKDMSKGEQAINTAGQIVYEKMQRVFGKVDRILVCAGAGGGSGGGSLFALVDLAKRYLAYLGVDEVNGKVGVFLSLPTNGECASPRVAQNAYDVATKVCELASKAQISPVVMFDNDKIKRMHPSLTVSNFWPTVNATITGLFHTFNVLSTKDGSPTSFDPADYENVLKSGGCMIMGVNLVKKYNDGTDVSQAVRSNLENTLLCSGFNLMTAKSAACIAMASPRILNEVPGLMSSLETGFDTMANITGNATVFRGIYEASFEQLRVYTMLSGLETPTKRLQELLKFKGLKG